MTACLLSPSRFPFRVASPPLLTVHYLSRRPPHAQGCLWRSDGVDHRDRVAGPRHHRPGPSQQAPRTNRQDTHTLIIQSGDGCLRRIKCVSQFSSCSLSLQFKPRGGGGEVGGAVFNYRALYPFKWTTSPKQMQSSQLNGNAERMREGDRERERERWRDREREKIDWKREMVTERREREREGETERERWREREIETERCRGREREMERVRERGRERERERGGKRVRERGREREPKCIYLTPPPTPIGASSQRTAEDDLPGGHRDSAAVNSFTEVLCNLFLDMRLNRPVGVCARRRALQAEGTSGWGFLTKS